LFAGAQDPSGPILIDKTWHVFADSISPGVRGLYWAKATSVDLVNWVAGSNFVTGSGSTGSIVPVENQSSADDSGYTFHSIDGFGSHHVAASSQLEEWTRMPFVTTAKGHANKPGDPEGLFRVGDPSRPFRFGDDWLMIVGGGANGRNGTWATAEARLYRSDTYTNAHQITSPAHLNNWTYVGIAFASNVSAPNPNSWGPWNDQNPRTGMWECIDFFRIGSKWMLMTSQITEGNSAYENIPQKLTEVFWIGDFDGKVFTPLNPVARAMDFGFVAAAKTGGDLHNTAPSGRRVFFGWTDPWTRFHGAKKHSGGSTWKSFSPFGSVTQPFGSQTLPRDLWLDPIDNSLRIAPVPELQSLRKHGPGSECHLSSGGEGWIECAGRQLELNATVLLPSESSVAQLVVLASKDCQEETIIQVNRTMLALDRRNASLTPDATDSGKVSHWFPQNRSVLFAPLRDAGDRSTLNVRVFVDGSVLEIFVNDRVALTGLVFPVLEDSVHVRVEGVATLDVWLLSPTQPVVAPDARMKNDDCSCP
jgi:beta-fructofuranosidase